MSNMIDGLSSVTRKKSSVAGVEYGYMGFDL